MSSLISWALNYYQDLRKWCNWAYVRQELSDLTPPDWYKEKKKGFRKLILTRIGWTICIYTAGFWVRAEAKSNFLLNEHCWQQSDFTNQVLVVSKVWGHLLLIYRLSWMTERKCMFCMQPCPWCLLFLNQQVLSGVYRHFSSGEMFEQNWFF